MSLSFSFNVQSCIVPALPKLIQPTHSLEIFISVFPRLVYSIIPFLSASIIHLFVSHTIKNAKDSVASHKRFEEKYGLAFTLLADPERKVIEAYDVWKEKKNYGKVSMGVVRTTYLIDEQGVIIKANDKVKAANDPKNMLKELD